MALVSIKIVGVLFDFKILLVIVKYHKIWVNVISCVHITLKKNYLKAFNHNEKDVNAL